jgi:hypothetical protein
MDNTKQQRLVLPTSVQPSRKFGRFPEADINRAITRGQVIANAGLNVMENKSGIKALCLSALT